MTIYDDIRSNAASAEDMVENQFVVTQGWATTMMNQTLSFLNALSSGSAFTVPEVILSNPFPTAPIIGNFDAVSPGEFILSYSTPTRPTVVVSPLDGIFLFSGSNYSSLISSEIVDKLLDIFNNGGTGLNSDVEAAIFARALARKELKDSTLYTEAEDYFASRGWVLPPGVLSGRLLEIQKEIYRENGQLNYEVMIKQAELADQNTRHNLEQAIQLETLTRTYYIQNELKDLEISKTISLTMFQEFSTKVEAGKLSIQLYEADIQNMIALIDAQVKAYIGKVEAYRTQADAYKSTVTAKTAVYETEANVIKIDSDIQLGEINAELSAFLGLAQLNASISEAAARVSAQVAAGAMSAVNAGVSFSYGANQGASASDNYNESHSYANDVQEILYAYE